MNDLKGWEEQPGGLWLKVSPFDKRNPEHRHSAAGVMQASVQTVAKVHGAAYSERSFRANMKALNAGNIKVVFFLAKWEICAPKPIILGAALNWNTVGIDPHGQTGRAVYTEDLCLLNDPLRQLIRERPKGKEFPEMSLAECFERLSIKNLIESKGAVYKYGEVNPDNKRMIEPLENTGGFFGKGSDSAVLEIERLPNNLLDKFPMIVTAGEDEYGLEDENTFIARWAEGLSDIRFIVTKGQATALGKPRVDIRPWHNGILPKQPVLECVLSSALLAIKQEVERQEWGEEQDQGFPSPNIPLMADRPEIYTALYEACGDELFINVADRPGTFDKPMPDAHIYIINDQRMLDAFMTIGTKLRLFGGKPTVPGVNIIRKDTKLVV